MTTDLNTIKSELKGFSQIELPYDLQKNTPVKYLTIKDNQEYFYTGGKFLRFGGQSGNDFIRAFKKESYNYSIQWMDEHASVNGLTYKSKINVDEMNYDRMFSVSEVIY